MKSDDSSWEFWGQVAASFLFATELPQLSYFTFFWLALAVIYFGHYYTSAVRVRTCLKIINFIKLAF